MQPGDDGDGVERLTQSIGRELWAKFVRRQPSVFERKWWDDQILSWAMSDESVKVQMFRFVDVLPTLRSREDITRHLQEYFEEVSDHLPRAVRLALEVSSPDSLLGRALAVTARSNAVKMAERFIAGTKVDEVLRTLEKLRRQNMAFTLDLLGEAIVSEDEADVYQAQYLTLLKGLAPLVDRWATNPQLDHSSFGPVPRVNVSLKLSALFSQFNPIDPEGTAVCVKQRLRPILREAMATGAHVHIDMEHYAFKDLTLRIFEEILLEDEFRKYANFGIVIQTYLPDAGRDLARLREWVERRGTPVTIRLVKGAYWDYETVVAQAKGWPIPVYQKKWQSDENFERQTRFLIDHAQWLRPAFGSHNLRSLSHALAYAQHKGLDPSAIEIQMLYGMGADQAVLFVEKGYRVRVYTPFGELIPGMAYLVRRLLENTSNDSFLRASFAEHVKIEELLMPPSQKGAQAGPPGTIPEPPRAGATLPDGFSNEPLSDFGREEVREAMRDALVSVEQQLGNEYPLVIAGERVATTDRIESRDPSQPSRIIGITSSASKDDALRAIAAAKKAHVEWSRLDESTRADYLDVLAEHMRARRFELAAWQAFECGKPWTEADADVAEAIDFCVYYADQMRQLAMPRQCDVPGEENSYFYRSRGVAVVIAPWNFPLAILTGMTVAAAVAGNTVIMKPAEQSSIVGAKLMDLVESAGFPEGVINYLPGVGEVVGPTLVEHPDVSLIAFTGSQAVGLWINQHAAVTGMQQSSVKRVIAEMGGKNAVIIDDDANLDEAVLGVVQSAFGYAGQKCSACSRAIVVGSAYDDFVKRLASAVKSLAVGPATSAGTFVGPVIDGESQARVRKYIDIGFADGKLLAKGSLGPGCGEGYFVEPHVFVDVPVTSRLAQEEVFGPVLVVLRANDFDEALDIANGTRYALTGGVYSRSPAHLKLSRQAFEVGNLYLNRPITGALVDRHPFGGFKMSGIGSKAGGPDYLQQFLIPVSVTENTLRRGFAPEEDRTA